MIRAYTVFRLAGYVAGLAGLILFTLGRQDPGRPAWFTPAGGALLLLSFACFFASYVLFVLNRLMRR
jgi:hypothetical protein